MVKKQLESKVADAMLQAPKTVTIGDREYEVAPPTFGTLMLVSEILARVPDVGDLSKADAGIKAAKMLQRAKDFGVLPEILATLVLGSKHINDTEERVERRRKGGVPGFFGAHTETVTKVRVFDSLVSEIRDNVSPYQMSEAIPWLISSLQLSDFFVLTTFLRDINLAEPTKVDKKVTAHGPLSRASSKASK